MRKCRAKCVDTEKWVVGYYVPVLGKNHQIFADDGTIYTVDPDTLEESIEIPDKYGNDIFTGNVLRIHNDYTGDPNPYLAIVGFRKGKFVCITPDYLDDDDCNNILHESWGDFDSYNVPYVWWEIVGDIHEAPITHPICEVGDTVFYIDYSSEEPFVNEAVVEKVLPYTEHVVVPNYGDVPYKNVFKVREDAEKALNTPEVNAVERRRKEEQRMKQFHKEWLERNYKRKSIWLRLGVSVDITDEDVENILFSNGASMERIIRMAIKEGHCHLDGDTYIPECVVEEYNKKYGTEYEIGEYGCDLGFATLALKEKNR